jgi:hypothetical protein
MIHQQVENRGGKQTSTKVDNVPRETMRANNPHYFFINHYKSRYYVSIYRIYD